MEIILLEKVANLGALGDKVRVKNGYARNFLFPKGKAKPATAANLAAFEARRAELEKAASEALAVAATRKEKIDAVGSLTVVAKTASEGKLFGSIGTVDICEAAQAAGLDIEKREVRLPTGNLRETGTFDVTIHLHTDLDTVLKVIIKGEE
ncbi:MAG: 50S ribosomal protein L9 [Gammaproteobacteria bacterium]|nr:50S ribosomal protein L9 [Gammaproteobacteria bacterium]